MSTLGGWKMNGRTTEMLTFCGLSILLGIASVVLAYFAVIVFFWVMKAIFGDW